jgi:protein ImuA
MLGMSDHFPHRSADCVAGRVLTLQRLAGQLQKLERNSHPVGDSSNVISSGLEVLDRLLPDAGFRAGTLIEWMAAKGSADQLALLAARLVLENRAALEDRAALGEDRVLIVIDDEETLYPPAAAALGIDLRRLILVHPGKIARREAQAGTAKRPAAARVKATSVETLWALEQALASRGVAVTFCRLEKLSARVFRRLQLAAERGRGLGFLIRPATARGEPSWSDVRLGIEAMSEGDSSSARRWRVEVLRCRRGAAGERFALLEYDDATNTVRPIAPVAAIAPGASPRRARA